MNQLSKDQIKDRMLKRAAKKWGYNDVELENVFDPIVNLLFDVCAKELEKISNDQYLVLESIAKPNQNKVCLDFDDWLKRMYQKLPIQGTFVPCALKNNSEEGGIICCDDKKI